MNCARQAILERVLTILSEQAGRPTPPDGADKLIGAEHGVTGWDMVEALDRLEGEYWVDLQPFVDARVKPRKAWLRMRRTRRDPTARELADYIYSLVRHRQTEHERSSSGKQTQPVVHASL